MGTVAVARVVFVGLLSGVVLGCGGGASGGAGGDDDPDGGGLSDGGDADGSLPEACRELECPQGQACSVRDGEALCAGSCSGLSCAGGLVCRVQDDVGRCVQACDPACDPGQRCERADGGKAACVDNRCDDLDCGPLEACVPASTGSGHVCADNTCETDVDCEQGQNCNGSICLDDVCAPYASHCEGGVVRECMANGSGEITRVSCVSEAGLDSACVDSAGGARCSCRDDWDCPAFTECVQGRCEGTGRKPTCFVPPQDFASILPEPKRGFPWGGDDADGYVVGSSENLKPLHHENPRSRDAKPHPVSGALRPFPRHSQVSAVPVVANLDDDNGDGRVDELDTPEIIFPAFCDQNYQTRGMLRAVHGGGPNAGGDFFAICNGTLWQEGQPLPDASACACNDGDIEPNGGVAVADLDGEDGLPEVIVMGHAPDAHENNKLLIYRNTGEKILEAQLGFNVAKNNPAVTIANLDHQGLAEIVVGATVIFLRKGEAGEARFMVDRVFRAPAGGMQGVNNGQGAVSCVAELKGGPDSSMEIVAGGTMYSLPESATCTAGPNGFALCELAIEWNKGVEGFCAVADVLGPIEPERETAEVPTTLTEGRANLEHPLDGRPEVLLISNGQLRVYDAETGKERLRRSVANRDGGPPNVDDFDGDGFPEVGTAFELFYTVLDFQAPTEACPAWDLQLDGDPSSADPTAGNPARTPPLLSCERNEDCGDPQFACGKDGQCTCLHNGWRSRTQDASSRVTGSSVFDFNGDGVAEVVYNDECYFRIYEGKTGKVYQRLDSQSPTRIEYPVVADVDSDGNAEIVYSGSNARSEHCGPIRPPPSSPMPDGVRLHINGINVIGDPTDSWISARRIWNQHAYHITNVHEDGRVPLHEVPSWRSYAGRNYNTYRSNLPPVGNVAPDLTVLGLQVNSPGVSCGGALGRTINIVALIRNQGDLRTGPDVLVRFADEDDAELGLVPVGVSLEPGAETFVTLTHDAGSAAALPARVRAMVDYRDPATQPSAALKGSVRECREDNNELEIPVKASDALPELRVSVSLKQARCPNPVLRVTAHNDSDQAVNNVKVRLYAGNPAAGGSALAEHTFARIDGNAQQGQDIEVDISGRRVSVYAVVDPDQAIAECDDSNNSAVVEANCMIILY